MSFACIMKKLSLHFIIFKIRYKFLLASIESSKEAAPHNYYKHNILNSNPFNLFFTIV